MKGPKNKKVTRSAGTAIPGVDVVQLEALLDFMRGYFEDGNMFSLYRELLLEFNDRADESSEQTTKEVYTGFFSNLNKIERAVREISYFITRKCNLVTKLNEFLAGI